MTEKEILDKLVDRLVDLDTEETLRICTDALAEMGSKKIMDKLIEGSRIVGEKYRAREYFLVELIMVGEIMKEAMKIIQPRLVAEAKIRESIRGSVVIGTVKGDLHDIEKNIVVALLKANMFEVYDLGIDVSTKKFVEKVMEVKPDILDLSGLLTTALPSMEAVIRALMEAA